jgi:hypothetical protein
MLVRLGREKAAEAWREAVAERTCEVADQHLERFNRLTRQYGMRLPTIADRLGERFVRLLAIDQLRALVRPAYEELRGGETTGAVARLEAAVDAFAADVSGAGIDVPPWLDALAQELDAATSRRSADDLGPDPRLDVPQVRLRWEAAQQEIESLCEGR